MNVSAIRKHKQGTLYFVQKTDKTLAVPYVGSDMRAVLQAYRDMWEDDPYSLVRGNENPVTIISAD